MSTVIKASAPNADWAVSGIKNPFFFLPLDLATNNPTAARIITNITQNMPPALALPIVDADGTVDALEGWYTADPTTDLDGMWFGPGYDSIDHPVHKMFNIFDLEGGTTGKTLLLSWKAIVGTLVAGTIVDVASSSGIRHGWRLATIGNSFRLTAADAQGAILLPNSDLTSLGVPNSTVENSFTLLLDTKNGKIVCYRDGVALTNANLAAQLAVLANYTGADPTGKPVSGITLFAQNNAATQNSRTLGSAMAGAARSFFAQDLTNYTGAIDIATIAQEWARSPAYTIPKYMERF